jgi:tRNA(fMet)-specific endonuclease VapC
VLWSGAEIGPTRLRTVVNEFLLMVTVLPWDSDAARQYGQLRATLERKGQPMGSLDMMIGAHALASALILVTNDRAFGRVKELKVQDWTKP